MSTVQAPQSTHSLATVTAAVHVPTPTPATLPHVCACVARVALLRSIQSPLKAGSSLLIEVMLSSEFNEPIEGMFQSYTFTGKFYTETNYAPNHLTSAHQDRGREELVSDGDWEGDLAFITQTSANMRLISTKRHGSNSSSRDRDCEDASLPNVGVFQLMLPRNPGRYRLLISCSPSLSPSLSSLSSASDCVILELLSDTLVLVKESVDAWRRTTLLSSFRVFPTSTYFPSSLSYLGAADKDSRGLILREEYGTALGTHIYDSAVVLIRYLHTKYVSGSRYAHAQHTKAAHTVVQLPSPCWPVESFASSPHPPAEYAAALELGSGCGLVGLFLQRLGLFRRVLLTDKATPALATLLRENIHRNGGGNDSADVHDTIAYDGDVVARFCTLDWTKASDIADVLGKHLADKLERTLPLKLIVAADVWYGVEVATVFFTALRGLLLTHKQMHPHLCSPDVLVAQKKRSVTATVSAATRTKKTSATAMSEDGAEEGEEDGWALDPSSFTPAADFQAVLVIQELQVRVWSLQLLAKHN